jgi:toxin ParE1/3/4
LPDYRLSKLARTDPIEIADYTVDTWGPDQAYRYLDSLDACFHQLAQMPGMGRPCNSVRHGYRRLEHEKHIIFYRVEKDGIFISRTLHERMLPSRHMIEDSP